MRPTAGDDLPVVELMRRAYNRSDYLEQRRPMMQWWADLVKAADSGSIVLTHLSKIRLVG